MANEEKLEDLSEDSLEKAIEAIAKFKKDRGLDTPSKPIKSTEGYGISTACPKCNILALGNNSVCGAMKNMGDV